MSVVKSTTATLVGAAIKDGYIRSIDDPVTRYLPEFNGSQVDYGYMLWPVPEPYGEVHKGAYEALGVFGQRVYVNPADNVVIAIWSAWPKPLSHGVIEDLDFLLRFAKSFVSLHSMKSVLFVCLRDPIATNLDTCKS